MGNVVKAIFSDADKATALNAFLRTGGDFAQTHRVLRAEAKDESSVPSTKVLRIWSEKYAWEMTLNAVRNRLQADAAKNALAQIRRDVAYLEAAKSRLIEEIGGKYNADGECIYPPIAAKTLEGAANALVKIIEAQIAIRGEEQKHEKMETENAVLALIRAMIPQDTDGNTTKQSDEISGTGDTGYDPAGDEPVDD